MFAGSIALAAPAQLGQGDTLSVVGRSHSSFLPKHAHRHTQEHLLPTTPPPECHHRSPLPFLATRGRAEGLRRGAQLESGASRASAVRNDFSMLLLIFFPPLQLAQKMISFSLPDHWLSLLV